MASLRSVNSADDTKQRHKKHPTSSKHKDGDSASASSSSKKSNFGLEGFSFRRLLNSAAFNRSYQSRSKMRNKHSSKETYFDNGPSTANKETHEITCTQMLNSNDFESHSLSSGPSDLMVCVSSSSDYKYFNGSRHISSCTMECPLCLMELPIECFPGFATCSHRACFDCLQQYLKIEISESRINISCPECIELIHPNDIKIILNDESFINKYENFMLRRVLVTEPDARWCPAPDCGYVVIATGCASCPKLKCSRPGCDTSFCYHCKQEWHPNQTCDAARAQRSKKHQSSHTSYKQKSSLTPCHESRINRDEMKPCPCCKIQIIKMNDGSCNHMTCSICGTEFCWLCLKEISDLHYLSPSGCTFWGKKPWSRKKKILWQLGLLIGAPVGIALIAGIAVPAIIIGLPVCVGRKLHARYAKKTMSKYKKNLMITTGVVTSVIISPILSAVAVGIGVPILLAYVYGVVPISLCRSGGCAVTTSSSGVKFELDDEESGIGFNVNNPGPDAGSVDIESNKGVNASIDEISLGPSTSLSLGSNYHLDKFEFDQDASTGALAGSIVSTSKMHEVIQIDLSSNKRFSITSSGQQSETASNTLSFNYSANISLGNDASTKALAGSIVGYKDVCIGTTPTDSNGVAPIEINDDDDSDNLYQSKSCCCEDALSTKSAKVNHNKTFNTKWISSNQNGRKSKFGKYESRSCEQLANYCSTCNKTHRPCCPMYSLSIQANSKSSSIEKHSEKENKMTLEDACLTKKSRSKSVHSDPTYTTVKKRKELKRVKSSDNSKKDEKAKENKVKSISSSPVTTKS